MNALLPPSPAHAVRQVVFTVYPGTCMLDLAGAQTVFWCANRHLKPRGLPGYALVTASIGGNTVETAEGTVLATASLDAPELQPDTVLVPGTAEMVTAIHELAPLVAWLRASDARRIASVCTGSFLLAAAGLLDGRRATTHWEDCERLRADFPLAEVQSDAIFVQDGKCWTAAGITSGIDMALAMIEEDYGHRLALMVARNLVVFLKRPGGQSQFSAMLQSQSTDGPLGSLLDWIVAHPREDLRAETLADRANMSLRNFYRTFETATGASPAEWVETARVEIAKRLLSQGTEAVDQVAYKSGFASYDAMRKAFARRLGVTPTAYRERFAPRRMGAVEPPTAFGASNLIQ